MIKFALIGCGVIAKKHAIAIRRLTNAQIVGAFDTNLDVAQTFGKENTIPIFKNIEEMITKTNPDILNILTPSGVHTTTIIKLLHFNKHFVVEKPLALRLDHIDQIIEQCDKRNLKIFVVQQNRFNPPIQKLKEALVNNRFGKLVLGTIRVRWCRTQEYYDQKTWRGTWLKDGGVFTNQASHHIDALIWLMGDIESVMAKTTTRLVNIETEDTGVAILKFKNGALGVLEATTATRPKDLEGSISILGENGSVEIAGFFMNHLKTWNFKNTHQDDANVWNNFSKVPDEFAWNHSQFFKNVMDSLINNKHGLIDGFEGRKSVELINAIYESVETGKEVMLHFVPKKCRLGV